MALVFWAIFRRFENTLKISASNHPGNVSLNPNFLKWGNLIGSGIWCIRWGGRPAAVPVLQLVVRLRNHQYNCHCGCIWRLAEVTGMVNRRRNHPIIIILDNPLNIFCSSAFILQSSAKLVLTLNWQSGGNRLHKNLLFKSFIQFLPAMPCKTSIRSAHAWYEARPRLYQLITILLLICTAVIKSNIVQNLQICKGSWNC